VGITCTCPVSDMQRGGIVWHSLFGTVSITCTACTEAGESQSWHAGETPSNMPMADNPTAVHIFGWPGNTGRLKLAQQPSIGHTALATITPASICAY
jgi:hypothetical protein